MSARIASLSPRAFLGIAVGAVLLYSLVAWFLFVSPKRAEVANARADVASAELRLVEAQAAANRPGDAGVPVSEVFRLAKAMPASNDQPGLILELSRLARSSGATLSSITPQASVGGEGGTTMIPVAVTIGGSYFEISKFLRRVRTLVNIRDGELQTTGRLLTVQHLALAESVTDGFPMLDATMTLNAYVYDGPILPPDLPDEPDEEDPSSSGSTAAGGTS